jgi:hypothetical protein
VKTIAAIALFLIVVCVILVIYWKKKNAIFYSSVPFLLVSLLGCAIIITTVFLFTPVPTDNLCTAVVWTITIGTTVFFIPLLAKTYRIVHIYQSAKHFKKSRLTTVELVGSCALCLIVDIVLLICFTTIDSPYATEDFTDNDLSDYEYRIVCKYPDASATLIYIILGWKALYVIVGVFLTFLVRNTSKTFNESKHLSLAIYDCTFVFAVIIPLIAVLNDEEAQYLLICLGITLGTTCAFLVIFLPKFWIIITDQDEKLSRTSSTKSTKGGSSMTT